MARIRAHFKRLGVILQPDGPTDAQERVLNPACARLRDGSLQLYPRMVTPGNVSRIGSFRTRERPDGALVLERCGYVLEPEAPYELRDRPGGYGCEDPRVTYVEVLDIYVMAYVAFGPRGPEVAVAVSDDGLVWKRLGLMRFGLSEAPFADKDAAFFPEPVRSPAGLLSLALYHRPSIWEHADYVAGMEAVAGDTSSEKYESISIGYVSLDAVREDVKRLCEVTETHPLVLPAANWGHLKVGAGTPPVRVPEGWLSVIHGVDLVEAPGSPAFARYCAGVIVHDAHRLDHVIYRSPAPLFAPKAHEEIHGTVGHVVFPTAIDGGPDGINRTFDIYYGMGDDEIGRGRLTLD
jgi:beta-1,2-mannobiose phosphorylase / 1,2-beta-oligomannan phosphorylase